MNPDDTAKSKNTRYLIFCTLSLLFPAWGPVLFSMIIGWIAFIRSFIYVLFYILWPLSVWPVFRPFTWQSIFIALIYYFFSFFVTFFIGWASICSFDHC